MLKRSAATPHPWQRKPILGPQVPAAHGQSAFSLLDAPSRPVHSQPTAGAKLLPAECGTYVLCDRSGQVLYVGKAKDVQARVRGHLRDRKPDGLLASWTVSVARIEARIAHSELEALLVEADLVSKLRPPFNRHLRRWPQYCYLAQTDEPRAPLSLCLEPEVRPCCFGPYRSRGQAMAIVEAVFRVISRQDRDRRALSQCYGLLAGEDDSPLIDLEHAYGLHCAADGAGGEGSVPKHIKVLRNAFSRAVLLRAAEKMLAGLLLLPGPSGAQTIAMVTREGLYLDAIDRGARTSHPFLERYRFRAREAIKARGRRLPRSIADCLCIAVRQVSRASNSCRFIPAETACRLSAKEILEFHDEEPEKQADGEQNGS